MDDDLFIVVETINHRTVRVASLDEETILVEDTNTGDSENAKTNNAEAKQSDKAQTITNDAEMLIQDENFEFESTDSTYLLADQENREEKCTNLVEDVAFIQSIRSIFDSLINSRGDDLHANMQLIQQQIYQLREPANPTECLLLDAIKEIARLLASSSSVQSRGYWGWFKRRFKGMFTSIFPH